MYKLVGAGSVLPGDCDDIPAFPQIIRQDRIQFAPSVIFGKQLAGIRRNFFQTGRIGDIFCLFAVPLPIERVICAQLFHISADVAITMDFDLKGQPGYLAAALQLDCQRIARQKGLRIRAVKPQLLIIALRILCLHRLKRKRIILFKRHTARRRQSGFERHPVNAVGRQRLRGFKDNCIAVCLEASGNSRLDFKIVLQINILRVESHFDSRFQRHKGFAVAGINCVHQ